MNRSALLVVCCVALVCGFLPAQDAAPEATVATHYFYWYRYPDQHFPRPGGEGHRHHFVDPEAVDYRDPAWHRGEFRAMAATGIDVALPVYWGCAGCAPRVGTAFSDLGLPAMVVALDELRDKGEPRPRLGMFYDTSTLAFDGRSDLTTAAGRQRFVGTVLRFFEQVPERHWARHRGHPLVVLYSAGFAVGWDAGLGGLLDQAFAKRFPGETPFLVADVSWGDIGQDATTAWGAALHGPKLYGSKPEGSRASDASPEVASARPRVAQVGPGYDDSPVPGRRTPIRPREDGAFYRSAWRAAILHEPELVLIETWNELHEGTGICATREFGDRYLELTRESVARLRRGDPGPEIQLEHAAPVPRPDLSWGGESAGAESVSWRPGAANGLRPIPWEDGPIQRGDAALLAECPTGRHGSYVYLQVSDHWRFALSGPAAGRTFELVVRGAGLERVRLDYDSTDAEATLRGAYRHIRSTVTGGDSVTFRLTSAHFGNRENGGADLRLVLPPGTALSLRRIDLRPSE